MWLADAIANDGRRSASSSSSRGMPLEEITATLKQLKKARKDAKTSPKKAASKGTGEACGGAVGAAVSQGLGGATGCTPVRCEGIPPCCRWGDLERARPLVRHADAGEGRQRHAARSQTRQHV